MIESCRVIMFVLSTLSLTVAFEAQESQPAPPQSSIGAGTNAVPNDADARQVSLEFGIISYDEDGRKLNGLDTRIDDAISAARYAKLASEGYRVVQSVAVPVTATSIRLAAADVRSNRVGSLEVKLPLAKTAKLEPTAK